MRAIALAAVLFDVDGTLVDSVDLHAEAWRETLARRGVEIDVALIRAQIGKGADQLLPTLLDGGEIERLGGVEALAAARRELFRAKHLPAVRGLPGARELILRLRDDGIAVALATSADPEELAALKAAAGIDDLPLDETSSGDVERSKPAPDIFQAAFDRLRLPDPRLALVVGDSPHDATAAARAGLACVGLRSGGFTDATLHAAGVARIYDDPADLLAHYDDVFA